MDIQPADNEAIKTQEEWIQYFNQQGKRMISAPDVYRIGQKYLIGQNGTRELVQSVRDDFERSFLITSTRETYNPNILTLDAIITHNFGSTVVQPTEKTVLVPVYQCTPLDEVLKTEKGVDYLRIKFDTNDSPDKIKETFAALSGKPANLIYIWTPTRKSMLNYQERVASFGFGGDGFLVGGDCKVYGLSGRSRGVVCKIGEADAQK